MHASGPITSVTQTVTSVHTVTTKTIEILQGYAMISTDQIQNVATGEILTMDEARKQGIVKDESETKRSFATKEIKQNFSDAIRLGLVNISEGTYTKPCSGETIPIQQQPRAYAWFQSLALFRRTFARNRLAQGTGITPSRLAKVSRRYL